MQAGADQCKQCEMDEIKANLSHSITCIVCMEFTVLLEGDTWSSEDGRLSKSADKISLLVMKKNKFLFQINTFLHELHPSSK